MRGRISRVVVKLDEPTRVTWEGWVRSPTTPVGRARRARARLLLAAGERFVHVAERVGLAERHVRKWALRFRERGVVGLHAAARPGRPPTFSPGGGPARGQGGL
ncbi:MAG: helix-turn-helix domain-containing protein [Chloroflexota bacterium]